MANSTLTDLTAASTLDGTELVYTVQGAADRKATVTQINASRQPLDGTLTALAALDSSAGYLKQTGAATFVKRALTAAEEPIASGTRDMGSTTVETIYTVPAGKTFFFGELFVSRPSGTLAFATHVVTVNLYGNTPEEGNVASTVSATGVVMVRQVGYSIHAPMSGAKHPVYAATAGMEVTLTTTVASAGETWEWELYGRLVDQSW